MMAVATPTFEARVSPPGDSDVFFNDFDIVLQAIPNGYGAALSD
jgi:hypothetical protein